jgi:formate hydrogenlyase subunit 3/multisubunit Na+/H+ antiporter MnhD subunit
LGSLLEAVYLMRWFGHAVKNSFDAEDKLELSFATVAPLVVNSLLLVGLGYAFASLTHFQFEINWILVGFVGLLYLLDFLPARVKTAIAMAGIAYYGYPLIQRTESYRLIFALIFIVGALVTLIPGFGKSGKRRGFYPVAVMMYAGLVGLIEANDMLFFFFSWEIMTLGSYFLILRGKKSKPHALSYMLFSLAGAYLILAGFALSYSLTGSGSISLDILGQLGTNTNAALVLLLLSVGFMTKTASAGLHVWLPGAHAEAEGDVSPMVSGILLKAGVLGLMMTLIYMGSQSLGFVNIPYVLGWIGVISMLIGNYMAAMQEDAKRMLAYSSIGQLGFILFGLALMSHLGWLVAMTVSVAHFIYKVVLFLAIGGVVARVKTRKLYEMGGLITRMPVSFTMVLISIIALSGVPPLAGFAGKWIVLNAIIEKGWYLQGALLSVAGFVAFLYLFRLIYSIFLGQLKDNHRRVKEAPFFMLVPQVLLIGLMMFFSFKPSSLLKPIGQILSKIDPNGALVWTGSLATSASGYWDGAAVMWIFMALFGVLFVLLVFINRRAQWVKQFNIVYAAERPNRPETTHFGYNFFAPYRRAVGFLEYPLAVRFWNFVTDLFHSVAGFVRLIYTGNGQTYLLQLVIFIVVTFLLTRGGQ